MTALTPRPQIGQRVRLRASTGIQGLTGRVGVVVGHHETCPDWDQFARGAR